MDQKKLQEYASLLIREGLTLKKGQIMEISANLDCAEFAHVAALEAYRQGAADVEIYYRDERTNTLRVNGASDESLLSVPVFSDMRDQDTLDEKHCMLSLASPNRAAAAGCDPVRLTLSRKSRSEVGDRLNNATAANELHWCVAAVPNPSWAKEVFPDLPVEEAMDKLWEEIFSCCYMYREGGWQKHVADTQAMRDKINALHLTSLHFSNSLGTDLTIKLIPNSIFQGGAENDPDGNAFCANMPTEEVFTSPWKFGTEGTVAASMPLLRAGELIRGIRIRFEGGKAVEVHADEGEESIRQIVNTDENSCYLGETALVSCESPIWQLGHLFYNTLFDENAACHLALGTGFPSVLTEKTDGTPETFEKIGLNQSVVHCDFMFGTEDMLCVGTTQDGREVTVMKDGKFAL